eukprot:1499143-Prymnesium_polylepis.2
MPRGCTRSRAVGGAQREATAKLPPRARPRPGRGGARTEGLSTVAVWPGNEGASGRAPSRAAVGFSASVFS